MMNILSKESRSDMVACAMNLPLGLSSVKFAPPGVRLMLI